MIMPSFSAAMRSSSFTMGPRAMFTKMASFFIRRKMFRSMVPSVSGVRGTWTEKASASSASSSREFTRVTPICWKTSSLA